MHVHVFTFSIVYNLQPFCLCVLACGGHTNGLISGTITSPNFGTLNYPLNTHCVWTITVPTNMSIEIVGTAVNTEPNYDFIHVSCFCFPLISLLLPLSWFDVLEINFYNQYIEFIE